MGREYLAHHPYPGNVFWLIEYSNSSLEKDLNIKTKIYAEVGISEYWVASLKKRQLIVFTQPQDTDYAIESTFSTGIIYPVAFPNVSITGNSIINS